MIIARAIHNGLPVVIEVVSATPYAPLYDVLVNGVRVGTWGSWLEAEGYARRLISN